MIDSLIRRTIVPDHAYAVRDIDSQQALAVAWKAGDGWRVGVEGGQVVAHRLTKTKALHLMHRVAGHQLDRAATRALGQVRR